MRSIAHDTRFSGDFTTPRAALRSSNFWLPASVAAKFMRASIDPLVNQLSPSDQPATFGGSKSCCSIVTIGFSGTYADETAYGEGIALAGKQSIRFKGNLRLLVPD